MKKFSKIISTLLSILLLVSCSSKKKDVINLEKDYTPLEYYHYEANDFYDKCDLLEEYANDNEIDKMNALYDELYRDCLEAMELYEICYVNYCNNVNDEYYSEEHLYSDDIARVMKNAFCSACHNITKSSASAEFKKHLNNDLIYEDYEEYIVKSQEILDLEARESELEQEYNEIYDSLDNYVCVVDGVTYTYGKRGEIDSADIYWKVCSDCLKDFNEDCGDIYLELVDIRDKIAKYYGYANFAEYADEKMYYRDYHTSDLENFKKLTKEFGYYMFYDLIYFNSILEDIDLDGDTLVKTTLPILTDISSLINDAYTIFDKYKLYSIDSGEGRYGGSFMTSLDFNKSAYLFLSCSNSEQDYYTLAHEFGHFTNGLAVPNYNPVAVDGCYDVFEIHSTGLEGLFGLKAESIFKDRLNDANSLNICDKFYSIIDGLVYDDFQRAVYENPDMTLDEINEIFDKTYEEYGVKQFYEENGPGYVDALKYEWTLVHHNFDDPMYYVSYATSAFAALQIFTTGLDNYKKAVKIWENIVLSNPYVDGYMKIVSDAGLKTFNDEEAVYDTYIKAFEYIEQE